MRDRTRVYRLGFNWPLGVGSQPLTLALAGSMLCGWVDNRRFDSTSHVS